MIKKDSIENKLTGLEFYLNEYGIPLLKAVLILIIGLIIIKRMMKVAKKGFTSKGFEPTLVNFLTNLVSWGLKILLVITVFGVVGIPMTSFVAILGAAGLAVGLALQGTLANFAGGVLLMVFKPYKIGDLVEVQGEIGVVKDIQIFTTILLSPENKTIFLPNGAIMNGNIKNYTLEGNIRVDLQIGISYNANIKKAKEVLLEIMKNNEMVLTEPPASVNVGELADSAVVLEVRPFVKPEHYWDVFFNTLEEAKLKLEENNIEIPYPQMDVYVNNK